MKITIDNIAESTVELVAKATGWQPVNEAGEEVSASSAVASFLEHCLKSHAASQLQSEARLAAKASAAVLVAAVESESLTITVE